MITPKEVIAKVHRLDERTVCELYAKLLPRAMETNPLKTWTMKMNPTASDLKELLQVLPQKDMDDIDDIYF